MTTTPSEVTTKLGLQPRSFVFVNTFGVTCSISMVADGMRDSVVVIRGGLLGCGQPAVDPEHLPGHERRGVGDEEDGRPDDVLRLADATEWDPVDDALLELRIAEQHRDLGRVDEGRHDRIHADAV